MAKSSSEKSGVEAVSKEEMLAEIEGMRKRIRLEWLDPRMLQPNAHNWKAHPTVQRRAFSDFFNDVGWVGALLYNEGTGHLLDGHMRQEEAIERNEELVPVLVVNMDAEQENRVLLFLDRIGTMYEEDMERLKALASSTDVDSQILQQVLAASDEALQKMAELDREEDTPLPEGGISMVLGESYNYVVLMFRTELDWVAAQDHFGLERERCAFMPSKVGIGRVVDGGSYLKRVHELTGRGHVMDRKESSG